MRTTPNDFAEHGTEIQPLETDAQIGQSKEGLQSYRLDKQETQWLIENLSHIKMVLIDLLNKTEKELYATQQGIAAVEGQVLPTSYGLDLADGILEFSSLLYSYMESYWLNTFALAKYVNSRKIKSLSAEAEIIGVQIDSDHVTIHMPYIPGRARRKNTLINDLLAAKLFSVPNFPKWEKYHLEFFHVYPPDTSDTPRDLDNYDYKRIIDLIAFTMKSTDCPCACSFGMQPVFTDEIPHGVYIEITPKNSENAVFPKWETDENQA